MAVLAYPDPNLADAEGLTRLRRWTYGDLACVADAGSDPRIPEGTTVPAAFTAEAGRAFIERQWARSSDGTGLSLAITELTSDVAVGLIVLMMRPQDGVAGVGYWIVPSARGRGHAGRSVRLLTDWALDSCGLARVEAWVEPANMASQSVLASAGFEHEGTLRSFLAFATRRADVMVFARIGGGR